jgi:hypothetical protein
MAEVVSESVNEPAPEKTVRQLRDELLEKIAKKELFIDTLETQRSDGLDFHVPCGASKRRLRRRF